MARPVKGRGNPAILDPVRYPCVFVPPALGDRVSAIDVGRDPLAAKASDPLAVVADLMVR